MSGEKSSEIKGLSSPFDLYDVLAYLVPGASFLLIARLSSWNTFGFIWALPEKALIVTEGGWLKPVEIVAIALLAAYVVGHVIATLSSLLIDKLLVDGCVGYPSEELLKIGVTERNHLETPKWFKRVFNVFLVEFAILTFFWPEKLKYVLGILILFRFVYAYRFAILFGRHTKKLPKSEFVLANIFMFFALPLVLAFLFVMMVFRMDRPLPKEVRDIFAVKFKARFGIEVSPSIESDVYWLTVIWIYENAPECSRAIRQWLRLYSFARNLAAALFISAGISYWEGQKVAAFWHFGFGMLFLVRYYYLYLNYYSKFIFRTFVTK